MYTFSSADADRYQGLALPPTAPLVHSSVPRGLNMQLTQVANKQARPNTNPRTSCPEFNLKTHSSSIELGHEGRPCGWPTTGATSSCLNGKGQLNGAAIKCHATLEKLNARFGECLGLRASRYPRHEELRHKRTACKTAATLLKEHQAAPPTADSSSAGL